MKRREFLKTATAGTLGAGLINIPLPAQNSLPLAVVVTNGEPAALVKRAVDELGGMSLFIKKGDRVLIKPNIGWDRVPQLAANTNPNAVAEVVKMCFEAGADSVKILDRTCNNPLRCYKNSQIEELAKEAGADVVHIRENRYKDLEFEGKILKSWPIYRDYLEADKVINIPIAKDHGVARVTLGLKNLMGIMGGNRGSLHKHFAQKITDITKNILPDLTIIDAYRILTANGPQGGNPDDVKLTKTVIASSCTVNTDILGLELFNLRLDEVEHIQTAYQQGLAKFGLSSENVKRIQLG